MSEGEGKPKKSNFRPVHLFIREDIYTRLWQIVKERYVVPTKKFGIVVNEALEEYVNKYFEGKEKS